MREALCKLCGRTFESKVLWYIPDLNEYMSICEPCVKEYVDEIDSASNESTMNYLA